MKLGLASLISPKLVLEMLKTKVEDHVKHKVNDFEMLVHIQARKVDFNVAYPSNENVPPFYKFNKERERFDRLYKYESPLLFDAITNLLKKEVQTSDTLDYAIISFQNGGKKTIAEIYTTNSDGKKLKHEISIYENNS